MERSSYTLNKMDEKDITRMMPEADVFAEILLGEISQEDLVQTLILKSILENDDALDDYFQETQFPLSREQTLEVISKLEHEEKVLPPGSFERVELLKDHYNKEEVISLLRHAIERMLEIPQS